jgi:hypothetical protein
MPNDDSISVLVAADVSGLTTGMKQALGRC